MSKKIDYRIVLVMIVAVICLQYIYFLPEDPVVDVVSVKIDEKTGGESKVIDSIKTVYVEVPGKTTVKKELVVDSLYKAKYEKAIKENDSLTAKNLFLESIALDTYEGTLIDNKDIKIDGKFITRGKLLEYDLDYTIKEDSITYTPQVVTRYPKFTLIGGVDLHLPTQPKGTSPMVSAHVGVRNKKGNEFSVGVDSQGRFLVGYEFVIFKSKR